MSYVCSLLAIPLLVLAGRSLASGLGPGPEVLAKAFDEARAARDERWPKAPDNSAGSLAWGEAGWLDRTLSAFEATGNTAYLDYFLVRAKQVLAMRDSVTGDKDYAGASHAAWPSNGHYTIGRMDVADDRGRVALEIETSGNSYNNSTSITMKRGKGGEYALTASNSRREIEETWMLAPTAESVSSVNEKSRLLRLRDKGWVGSGASLKAFGPVIPPTGRMVFSVHTGMIVMSLARFPEIVKSRNLKQYADHAKMLAEAAHRALAVHDPQWREVDGAGYYHYTTGEPMAFDGYPCPNNYTCAMGRAYIHLYRYDPRPEYRARIAAIASGLKGDMKIESDGSCVWHYWPKIALDLQTGDVKSVHTPKVPKLLTIEDISHGAIDVQLACMACEEGIVFDASAMRALARTLEKRVIKPDGTLAGRVDGAGTFEGLPSGWVSLVAIHPELAPKAAPHLADLDWLDLYKTRR